MHENILLQNMVSDREICRPAKRLAEIEIGPWASATGAFFLTTPHFPKHLHQFQDAVPAAPITTCTARVPRNTLRQPRRFSRKRRQHRGCHAESSWAEEITSHITHLEDIKLHAAHGERVI